MCTLSELYITAWYQLSFNFMIYVQKETLKIRRYPALICPIASVLKLAMVTGKACGHNVSLLHTYR